MLIFFLHKFKCLVYFEVKSVDACINYVCEFSHKAHFETKMFM